jgi:hypothetical protein
MSRHNLKQRRSNHEVTSEGADGCHNKPYRAAPLSQCVQVWTRCLTFLKVEEEFFLLHCFARKWLFPVQARLAYFHDSCAHVILPLFDCRVYRTANLDFISFICKCLLHNQCKHGIIQKYPITAQHYISIYHMLTNAYSVIFVYKAIIFTETKYYKRLLLNVLWIIKLIKTDGRTDEMFSLWLLRTAVYSTDREIPYFCSNRSFITVLRVQKLPQKSLYAPDTITRTLDIYSPITNSTFNTIV